jgi:hypothetical protein
MQEMNPTMPSEAPLREPVQPAPAPDGDDAGRDHALSDPRALQILSTEHWSLLAARSLSYNEAFSRASMFLSFLSATLIVIGFLVSSLGLTPTVGLLASILLGADLFVGLATVSRMIDASAEELNTIRGMNRIRHAYREMVPGLEPYFVTSFHDDAKGVLAAYGYSDAVGASNTSRLHDIVHGLGTTIGMIATIDAMILGALGAAISLGLGLPIETAVIVALVAFGLAFVTFASLGMRMAGPDAWRRESRFPTPD